MPRFAEQVEVAIEALSTNPPQAFEENEFIDASRLVYDGVRDIRKAVLMIRVCLLPVLKEQKNTVTFTELSWTLNQQSFYCLESSIQNIFLCTG